MAGSRPAMTASSCKFIIALTDRCASELSPGSAAPAPCEDDGLRARMSCRAGPSAAQLAGQPQDLAAFAPAVVGECAIAAGGVDRDGAEQLLEPAGAGAVEAQIGAARQLRHLLEVRSRHRVAAFV